MDALMEHMAIIANRLDAQAADTRQLMQRDALRNHRAPIAVDQPFLPPKPSLAPPLFRHNSPKHPTMSAPPARPAASGGRRPTIDHVVSGRAAGEIADFDKESINRSMKMDVPLMGPTT
jgi:hypothetical protein